MLIDWLSIKFPSDLLSEDLIRQYQNKQDRILRIAGDGSLQWEISAWDTVRSDSHQIAFQVNANHIRIQGSPARIIGDGDNVFSAGASAALDLVGCWRRMVSFVSQHTGLPLPDDYTLYTVTRVDVTENLWVGSLPLVRQALAILRECEGGRYRVSQQAGDSVYWSHRSRLRSGKAYAKGAEIAQKVIKAAKSKLAQAVREYTIEEISLASGLLRLELKLGAQFWRERVHLKWYAFKSEDLKSEWETYFSRMIGGAEIMKTEDIYDRLLKSVDIDKNGKPKEGQAKAAYQLWLLIKNEGWQKARDFTTKRTWYRNLSLLRKAGLSDADISTGNIVLLRKRIIEAQPVTSWAELRTIVNMAA